MTTSSDGGICMPMSPRYDTFRVLDATKPDPVAALVAGQALREWYHAPSSLEDDEWFDAATDSILRAYLETANLRPIRMAFPTISTSRGGISYLNADGSPVKLSWRYQLKYKLTPIRSRYNKTKAFVKRVSDAGAVLKGTKEALTDAELEDLREW